MENINIKVNKQTRMIEELSRSVIGNDGENLQENLVFSFTDEFVNGQARLELEFPNKVKSWITLTKVDETYQIPVKSIITKTGKLYMQLVIDEGIDEESVPIFKSNTFYVMVNTSINAVDEAPEGYEQWLEIADAKLNQIDNLDIDATKSDKTTTITITKKDGTQETTNVLDGDDGQDGVGLQYNWSGTSLGIKREDEQNYNYVNLKGDKGDAGSVKFIVVQQLPTQNIDTTAIYLVPSQTTATQNNYEEYIYVNNAWEKLGEVPIEVDLSDYYTKEQTNALIPTSLSELTDDTTHRLVTDTEKSTWDGKVSPTDYAQTDKGGTIKVSSTYNIGINNGNLVASNRTYANYQSDSNYSFIGKGTLDNVLNAVIGDIDSALDTLNGEVVS